MDNLKYKEKGILRLEVPSGEIFIMRRLSPLRFIQKASELGIDLTQEESIGEHLAIWNELLIDLSIDPKLTRGDTDENKLSINDLLPEDAAFLFDTLMQDISSFDTSSFLNKRKRKK